MVETISLALGTARATVQNGGEVTFSNGHSDFDVPLEALRDLRDLIESDPRTGLYPLADSDVSANVTESGVSHIGVVFSFSAECDELWDKDDYDWIAVRGVDVEKIDEVIEAAEDAQTDPYEEWLEELRDALGESDCSFTLRNVADTRGEGSADHEVLVEMSSSMGRGIGRVIEDDRFELSYVHNTYSTEGKYGYSEAECDNSDVIGFFFQRPDDY